MTKGSDWDKQNLDSSNVIYCSVLRIRDLVLLWPLYPDSSMERNPEPRSGIPDLNFDYLVSFFWVKNTVPVPVLIFLDPDPGSGSCQPWIWDGKKSCPRSWINIPAPQFDVQVQKVVICKAVHLKWGSLKGYLCIMLISVYSKAHSANDIYGVVLFSVGRWFRSGSARMQPCPT